MKIIRLNIVKVLLCFLVVASFLICNGTVLDAENSISSIYGSVDGVVGDCNGDGVVDSTDFALLKRYSLGLISDLPVENDIGIADLNDDGEINSTDLALMKRFILDIIKEFPKKNVTPGVPKGTTINLEEEIRGTLTTGDPSHYYNFTPKETGMYEIRINGDVEGIFYDEKFVENKIYYYTKCKMLTEMKSYIIQIKNDSSKLPINYTIMVVKLVDDYENTKNLAHRIYLNQEVIGSVNYYDDRDCFIFVPEKDGEYYIECKGDFREIEFSIDEEQEELKYWNRVITNENTFFWCRLKKDEKLYISAQTDTNWSGKKEELGYSIKLTDYNSVPDLYSSSSQNGIDGKWQEKPSMPTKRSDIAATGIDKKIYVTGGHDYYGEGTFNKLEVYDTETSTWDSKKASMLNPRWGHASNQANGNLYVFGGSRIDFESSVEMYDPSKDLWTKISDIPTPRGGLGAVNVNGLIYTVGGYTKDGYTGVVEVFDPTNRKWNVSKKQMPTPRSNFGIGVLNGKIYVVGGKNGDGNYSDVVEIYDPITDQWSKKEVQTEKRWGLQVVEFANDLNKIGGFNPYGLEGSSLYFNDFVCINWGKWKNIKIARSGHAAVTIKSNTPNGDKIYVIGGYNDKDGTLNSVEEFSYTIDIG